MKLRTLLLVGTLGTAAVLASRGHQRDAASRIPATLAQPKTAGAASTARPAPPPPPPSLDYGSMELVDGAFHAKFGPKTVELTLDPELQATAENVLRRAKAPVAAIVAMAPSGEILAMAGLKGGDTAASEDAPELCTDVWAPAASIFKLVTAAALVDKGVSPNKKVCYHGGLRSVTTANLRDNPRRDRSCHDLSYAVSRSQNALLAKLVHRHLEPADLRRAATAFGFGDAPSFCSPTEVNRVDIPAEALEFARVSAGFWNTELSPLGGALVANIVATGGMSVRPRVIAATVKPDGSRVEREYPAPTRAIPKATARAVGDMMVGTIRRGGTGFRGFHDRRWRPFLPGIEIAGKTGTLTRSPDYLQYSWFVGYAPADKPEIVISVLLGNPAKWHLKAHTAARLVMQDWLRRPKPEPAPAKAATGVADGPAPNHENSGKAPPR